MADKEHPAQGGSYKRLKSGSVELVARTREAGEPAPSASAAPQKPEAPKPAPAKPAIDREV